MSARFFLDEDLSPRVAAGLRARGVDAPSVYEVGRGDRGIPDAAQLAYATAEHRVLVTDNRKDFQLIDMQWHSQGQKHSGILWCRERSLPRHDFGGLIRALAAVANEQIDLTDLCLPLAPWSVKSE